MVRLPLAQHPIAGLGEVPGDGDDGAAVAFAGSEASIEQADVGFAVRAQMGLPCAPPGLGEGREYRTEVRV